MNGAADILDRGVADHPDDAEFDIDLDVGDVGAEAALGAHRIKLHAGADRPAHRGGLLRKLLQRQRFKLAGIRADRMRRAVFPFHRFGIESQIFAARSRKRVDHLLGRLRHHDRGREQHAAAAGEIREADRRGIPDQHRTRR